MWECRKSVARVEAVRVEGLGRRWVGEIANVMLAAEVTVVREVRTEASRVRGRRSISSDQLWLPAPDLSDWAFVTDYIVADRRDACTCRCCFTDFLRVRASVISRLLSGEITCTCLPQTQQHSERQADLARLPDCRVVHFDGQRRSNSF